ncbi:Calcium-binding protein cml13, partial [Globisporangium splendens]
MARRVCVLLLLLATLPSVNGTWIRTAESSACGASSQAVEAPADTLVVPQGEPHTSSVADNPENKGDEGGEEGEATGNDAAVAVVTITALIAISILFELVRMTEILRETTDEMNMPFINTVFSELTTLGFIGLLLFVVTKLDVLSRISLTYLGEKEKLQETIEVLHMGLFLFIVIFLVLCCALLKLGMFVQNEWREFERGAQDIPCIVSEYVLATEPPRTWCEKLSLSRIWAARKARREMIYISIRHRFMDYRSNHPDPEVALRLAKEYQRNPDIRFPFHEYLSIISGEVMGRLIEIDLPTWIALEVFLVVILTICWQLGPYGEIWVMLLVGLLLICLNEFVHRRILCMRLLLMPPRLLKDAERLRRKNEWRTKHQLPLYDLNEKTWILESPETSENDFTPPYIDMLPNGGRDLPEAELAEHQRMLLGGKRGNGVLLALFSTRLVFLLTAMHLATFLMRTMHHISSLYNSWLTILVLDVLFLLPSILVTVMSLRIARDGLYAFNIEHMKVNRVIAKVMRILKARQTLRTLRFVAEMKIYLRETVRRKSQTHPQQSLPITASLRESSAKFSALVSPNKKQGSGRRAGRGFTRSSISDRSISPPLSPLAAYMSPREKRSDGYKNEMERRDINTIFCLFDVDGSGCVSRQEMANLLLAITHELDEEQLDRLMSDLVDGDNEQEEITFEAFYNWCHQHMLECAHLKEDLIEEIFHMVDTDKSGYITVDEFIAIFKTLGQSLDHDDVRELIYQMDRNDDGKIDLEEFTRMLQKHEV